MKFVHKLWQVLAIYYSLLSFSLIVPVLTTCKSESRKPKNPPPFFIFGDSFLDVGNNNYINTTTLDKSNFWPYGETYFKFPSGRFSDGRLVPDFIAKYANLPLIPPFLQPGIDEYHHGVNFASAGAGALVETFQGSVIDLRAQMRYFGKVESWLRRKLGNVEAKKRISEAVYLFSIGTNDYTSTFLSNSTVFKSNTDSNYVGIVIGNLTTVVKEIYKFGGRKFAFMNVPRLGCLPAIRILDPDDKGRCLENISSLATLHNRALFNILLEIENQLKGFKYSLFDLYSFLQQRMKHPSTYGFKEGQSACCGTGQFGGVFSCGGKRLVREFELCENPKEYVFWDSYHLTEKVYQQLADQIWNGFGHGTGPYSMKKLFHVKA